MRQVMRNSRVSARVGAAVLLPLAVLVGLSGYFVADKMEEKRASEHVQAIMAAMPAISGLTHEMQRERGMSSGFAGSRGAAFAAELPVQIDNTNLAIEGFLDDVADRMPSADSAVLSTVVNRTKEYLSELPVIRSRIAKHELQVADIATFYTQITSALLDIASRLGAENKDPRTSQPVSAYIALMRAKEAVGLQRAMGAAGFGAGKFDQAVYGRLVAMIAGQNIYLDIFKRFADDTVRAFFDATVKGDVLADVSRMRRVALDSVYTGSTEGVRAENWFEAVSGEMQLLRQVEQFQAAELHTLASAIRDQAHRQYLVLLIGTPVLALLTIAFALVMASSVTAPISRLMVVLNRLANGERKIDMAETDRRDEIGAIARALSSFRDLTERQKAELVEAEDRLRQILASTSEGIIQVQTDGVVSFGNHSGARLLGREPEELAGTAMCDLMHGVRREIFALDDYPAFPCREEGYCLRVAEHMLCRPDGSSIPVEFSVAPLRKNGKLIGSIVSLHDISERKENEKTLLEAKELAEAGSRAKAEFLANMSHEIRTPMNAIIGMTYLVLKTELTHRQKDYLTKIQQAGRHLLGIINDILDFSKHESGKLTLDVCDIDLEKVLSHVADLTSEKASAKGLELIFNVDQNVPNFLVGDPLRLGQILLNYISNSVKFTSSGEITAGVRCVENHGDAVTLRFEVHDTGIGLSEEQQSRLFQSFQQADGSITREYGGTGLGLAIAKTLAELMGGSVGVTSVLGQGSTFWFTARLGKQARAKAAARMSMHDLAGRRVLVVDDGDGAREVFAQMLSAMSFRVQAAASGAAAVEAVRDATEDPFEIVFVDWRMPEMDGIETCARIKKLRLARAPLLVLVTAHDREEAFKGASDVGCETVLIKPVTPSVLFDTIVRVLRLEASPDRHPSVEASPSAEAREATENLRGARVLLVEDNLFNQEVATEILQGLGVEVDVADNGAIAVEKVTKGEYDAVLMDVQMPVMDGLTAAKEIRCLGWDHLPIIAMTANVMQQDRDRCFAAGMNDHLAKPVDPKMLASMLVKWLRRPSEVLEQGAAMACEGGGAAGWPQLPHIDADVFDVEALAAVHQGDMEKMKAAVSGFLVMASRKIAALPQLVDDRELLQQAVSSLKTSAHTIGARGLVRVAGDIESVSAHGSPQTVAMQVELLNAEYTQLRSAIESLSIERAAA